MVKWKSALILRVNSASRKNKDVVWYVQKKNCGANFFTSTITGNVYQDIIKQFMSQLKKSERRSWLQQDNARPHVSTNTMSFLHEFFNKYHEFPTRIFQRVFDFHLPVASPQPRLKSVRFFLWGYLNNRVYMIVPRNLEELKGNVARKIENIDQKTLKHVFLNLMKRCRICWAIFGGHFQHLL